MSKLLQMSYLHRTTLSLAAALSLSVLPVLAQAPASPSNPASKPGSQSTGKPAETRITPEEAKQLFAQAQALYTQGKKQEARTELRTFLKDFPNDPFAPKAKEVLDRLNR